MAASTPAARSGAGTHHLGTALVAIALAIVFVAALVALQATASRSTPAAQAIVVSPAFDRGFAAKRGRISKSPFAVPGDHGWATDGNKLATPMFAVPGDHALATDGSAAAPILLELPRPSELGSLSSTQTTVGGGRGTRMAR